VTIVPKKSSRFGTLRRELFAGGPSWNRAALLIVVAGQARQRRSHVTGNAL
jgi:hypothetical protein